MQAGMLCVISSIGTEEKKEKEKGWKKERMRVSLP